MLLIVLIALSVISLVYAMVVTILSPPILLLTATELLDLFGVFLLVLLALEFFESIKIFLRDNVIPFELVVVIAITAISRKIIVLDYNDQRPAPDRSRRARLLARGGYYLLTAAPSPAWHYRTSTL